MGDKIKIWFGDDEELKMELLQKMEENGVRWCGDGSKPTSFIPRSASCFFIDCSTLSLSWSAQTFRESEHKEVSPEDYLYGNDVFSGLQFNEEDFLSLIS